MKMGRNMADIVKFIYVIIIFLSIFFFATNLEAGPICLEDFDCPKSMCWPSFKPRCSNGWCVCDKIMP
ncbi:putative Late nodulin [Medicago truncatula]|nr:putative Late nodulin [Medicago truncatula]